MTYLQAIYDRKFSESRTSFCEGNKRENFYYDKMKGNLVASERRGTGIRVRVSGDSAIVTHPRGLTLSRRRGPTAASVAGQSAPWSAGPQLERQWDTART